MEQDQNTTGLNNENIISWIMKKYFPYWPVFLLLLVCCLGAAWLYLYIKNPVFESSATILIKDEKKGTVDSKMMESLNLLSSKKIIENEIEVIKSSTILNEVVNELRLYAKLYESNVWQTKDLYLNSPINIEIKNPEKIVEVEKVNFEYDSDNSLVSIENKKYLLNEWRQTPWGIIKFSKNSIDSTSQKKGKTYFSLIHPKRNIENLRKNLEVSTSGRLSSVINLKIRDHVTQRSEDILNTIIISYEKAALNEKNALAKNTLDFLDDRLLIISSELDSIENKLQIYRSTNGAIDISSQGKEYLKSVSDNDRNLSEVNISIGVLRQVEKYVSEKNKKGSIVPSTLGIDDPLLIGLLNKLIETEIKYESLSQTTGENNPELNSLSNQIVKIRPVILENIHSQQNSLEINKNNLVQNVNSYDSLIQSLPQQEKEIVEISREQNIKSSIYSFLLQKREETALSLSSNLPDSRIIDKAESSIEPVGLKNMYIYGIAALFSFIVGFTFISLRELLSKTILFRKEIEAVTSFPIIGEIKNENHNKPLVIEEGKNNYISEQFRLIRTSLRYLDNDKKCAKYLITSTIPGEGKSFIAINLSMSLALSGKKVILVELDLSNPTLASSLGIIDGLGVADYLTNNARIEDVIQRTILNYNLSFITAGTLPSNPSELILQDKTKELLNHLSKHYDVVLVDSAPVGILTDGFILSSYCDATLYIVRHKRTPKDMLKRLDEMTKINEMKNMAIIFNGIHIRGFLKKSSAPGYGNGYDNSLKYPKYYGQ